MGKTTIKEALQLQQTLRLSDGTEFTVLSAAKLKDLEELMSNYSTFVSSGVRLAGLFLERNIDARKSFMNILYIMTDHKYDDEYLLEHITVADEKELLNAIQRFLGLQLGDTSDETEE